MPDRFGVSRFLCFRLFYGKNELLAVWLKQNWKFYFCFAAQNICNRIFVRKKVIADVSADYK